LPSIVALAFAEDGGFIFQNQIEWIATIQACGDG
jgi:hypothetical protein